MARQPHPWFRTDRKTWCVTLDGVFHNLGPDRRAAMARFRELQRKPRQARQVNSATSLAGIADEFLDWCARNRSAATFEWYRLRLQDFVTAHPQMTVEGLRPYHVERWAGNPEWSRTTRRNQMRAVKRCLKWGVAQGHLDRNPIEGLEIPSGESRDAYLAPADFKRLLTHVGDPRFEELLRVTYETGCRPQESLRVEARHLDLANERWVFPARESKGKAMPRVVYLTPYAVEVSRRLAEQHPKGPLFRNSAGRAWNKDSVGCAFDRLQMRVGLAELNRRGETPTPEEIARFAADLRPERCVRGVMVPKSQADLYTEAKRKLLQRRARQVGERCSLYLLRHSWATNALKSGVDALTVAILMGHKDPSTLARVYQHLSHDPGHLLKEARRVGLGG